MTLKKSGITLVIATLIFPLHFSSAIDKSVDESLELTIRFFHYMGQDSFLKAAGLFYYPEKYTRDELINEKLSVNNSLKEFKRDFGNIIRIKPFSGPEKIKQKIIGSGITGIKIKYWNEYSPFKSQYFLIDFEKYADVHIMVGYYKINDELFFHSFNYGRVVSDA